MKFENICQTAFLSLIVIFLFHYLFYYLQAKFTIPKVKDMINRPNEKYNSMMKVVSSEDSQQQEMKEQLSSYINEINTTNIETTKAINLNSNLSSNDNSFSNA